MANDNPIKTQDLGLYPDFQIPNTFKDKTLCVTTTTTIDKIGWRLSLIHSLSVNGDPEDFDSDPDIKKKEIGICKDLDNIQFALSSTASRIRDGAPDNIAPKVTYKLLFEADDEKIDEFELTTDTTNPITLYTKITLKMQP